MRCSCALFVALVIAAPAIAQSPQTSAPMRSAGASAQPGDKMVIKVYREPKLSDSVLVSSDGTIVLARIGTVNATHITIASLTDTIRQRYAQFLRNPEVDLVVLRRVSINGEVAKPDVYYVDVAMTLRDVIALAGGITDLGSNARVEIIRRGERIAVPTWQDDFTRASDLSSGDQIVVGKRSWLSRNAFSAVSSFALVASLLLSFRR